MMRRILAPRSFAAAPFVLLAHDFPDRYQLAFFTDHNSALAALAQSEVDLLCTGYTETQRFSGGAPLKRVCTYIWGLSALLVRDAQIRDFSSLVNHDGQLLLPFTGSPLDLQVRALFKKLAPQRTIELVNGEIPEILGRLQQGNAAAAVLPEPLATLLCEAGKAHRLGDLAGLWASAFGDVMTPQVSCFCRSDRSVAGDLMSDIDRAVLKLTMADEVCARRVAAAIEQKAEIILSALPHVIFSLPEAAEAERLESRYGKILDSL
ncbi:hypothetical protein [Turneriella parva]|uniref:Uncharacterized protein n=1 Tax=Turneriella parva (strain ATCC BAA-1111 / DSM 21527 / NCTC 11395 / H) TaxID=869212 RepID=I4B7Y0_TURPD|nr:hypothetical protein [Turneriella parva]AFM13387.1 hypothetical protein Turpa_2748 [Turneriella parva DSM 21527]